MCVYLLMLYVYVLIYVYFQCIYILKVLLLQKVCLLLSNKKAVDEIGRYIVEHASDNTKHALTDRSPG